MTLKTFEIDSILQSSNTLKTVAEYESFTDLVGISFYLNERLINRVSIPYESIKLLVTAIETAKFNEKMQ